MENWWRNGKQLWRVLFSRQHVSIWKGFMAAHSHNERLVWRWEPSNLFIRGDWADLPIQSKEAMAFRWMSGLINHLYLHFCFLNFSFDRHGKRPSPEPQYMVFAKYYQGIYFMSNCLGWSACYRTQFLTDLLKDPFLSSVISMVAPTWCHGAIGGNPFVGDWRLTGFPNLHNLIW